MTKRIRLYQAIIISLFSSQLLAQESNIIDEADPILAYNSDDGKLFSVKLKDGSTIELVDIDGLAYMGDMILGKTDELKRYGLDVANTDGIGTYSDSSDTQAPSAAIRYPTSAYKWPNGVIPYQIESSLSSQAKQDFYYAVDHWNNNTEVQLIPRTNQQDYLSIVNGGGCSSWIGRSGGRQTLTLARNCGRGAAVHEIGHAVGFFHEQTRMDRDNYINILWQNIQSNMSYNFQKINRQQGMDHQNYDYYSIMHYRTNAFGVGNRTTIEIKDSSVNSSVVGNSQQLSTGDLAATAYIHGGTVPSECQITTIQNGETLTLNGVTNSKQCFKLLLPDDSKTYQITSQADNGDADLFVRHNNIASQSSYDCKSDDSNSNENCSGTAQGGYLHVNLFAYQAFENLKLTANYQLEPVPTPCTVFDLTSGQNTRINVAAKSSMCFKLTVAEAIAQVEFNTNGGTGDADLYIKKGSLPTLASFDCKSAGETSSESCKLAGQAGDYYVRVFAWNDINGVNLQTKLITTPDNRTQYNGELLSNDQVDIQPNNTWFEYGGGTLEATLSASQVADLELVLQRWNGQDKVWYDLAKSTNPQSDESIVKDVNSGYYRYKIFSWNSESKSDYVFTLTK